MDMKCINPLAQHGMLYGCGQCTPCRVNKRRVWTHRLVLEASKWKDNCFLTLTYDDEHCPPDGSLEPKTLQDFVKRLRRYHDPVRLRYFAVGEYGSRTWRPHYHLALFNFATCERHRSQFNRSGLTCCQRCKDVNAIWGFGNAYLANLERESAQYISGYVIKKMTQRQDARLNGRHPEFSRMSLKPGIGAHAMEDVKSAITQSPAATLIADVTQISYGKATMPLGRYLTRRLRSLRGMEPTAPQSSYDKQAADLLALRMVARCDEENPSFVKHYKKQMEGKFASQTAKLKLKGLKNETL